MTDPQDSRNSRDAVTTPAGITTTCPQCGVTLDALTTACARCGAVITGGGTNGERAERLKQRLQGQIGGAYQLGALIGRGGMGIVFRAKEVALDREVALKVLAFDPILNPEAFTRFEREARLAARLDHPNIVPIFAVGQGEGAAYYTMRFVRGGSLEGLIADRGALPLDDAAKLLRDVASALDYAHAQGIVHRDIKPANILLSESGHAMVADFGIARAFTGDATTSTSGSHTGVVGSPAYMAPEQWRGDKPDGRADQYALGVLAFELLTGQRPFRDVSMQELLRLHLDADPPTVESVRKGLPPHVSDAIRRAMAKEPADRFPSAAAFIAALGGEAVAPAPKRAPARAAAPANGGSRWLGAAVVAVLLLVVGGAGVREWRKSRVAAAAADSAATAAPSDTLAERLSRELDDLRKIAEDAQRRAERAEALQKQEVKAAVAAQRGHVAVAVRGGTPKLFIDDKESAATTPAIIEVAPGRHIVRVEEPGHQYSPQQYVIDVSVDDTSKLVFSDSRAGARDFGPSQNPMNQFKQLGQGGRFPRPGDSTAVSGRPSASVAGGPSSVPNASGPSGAPPIGPGVAPVDAGSPHPFYLPQRIWQNMTAQDQQMLQSRWSRLSSEQQGRVLKDLQRRDSTGARFLRRMPQPMNGQPQPPTPPSGEQPKPEQPTLATQP